MDSRRLLTVVLFAYVTFDLADPVLPGAFSFEVDASAIEQVIHVRYRSEGQPAAAAAETSPERPLEFHNALTRQHLRRTVTTEPPKAMSARTRSVPRSALLAPAPATDDH